jgi:hypothetical protein
VLLSAVLFSCTHLSSAGISLEPFRCRKSCVRAKPQSDFSFCLWHHWSLPGTILMTWGKRGQIAPIKGMLFLAHEAKS